jgi:hypothetical protein
MGEQYYISEHTKSIAGSPNKEVKHVKEIRKQLNATQLKKSLLPKT